MENVVRKCQELFLRYDIPKEHKYASYMKSLMKLRVVFAMMFIFGIFEFIATFFSDTLEREMNGNMRLYYGIFSAFMLLGSVCTQIILKRRCEAKRKLHERLALYIILVSIVTFCALMLFEGYTFQNANNVVALYVILSVCILFIVDVNPFIFTITQFLVIVSSVPMLRYSYNDVSMVINGCAFGIIISYGSLSLMQKELKRIKDEESLRKYAEEMELEVLKETNKRTKLQESIVYSLADLVENRDLDTGEHIKRTALYVEVIAKEALRRNIYEDSINEEFIMMLRRAMPLHDIGKISIPDNILKAPRKLTPEEFEIMKTHTTKGAELVHTIVSKIESQEYIKMAENIARSHHEWWNGSGYPMGLQDYDIPVEARIAAIADVFDALVSNRCYKQAFTLDDALDLMNSENGTHFDPILLDCFLAKRKEIIAITENNLTYAEMERT